MQTKHPNYLVCHLQASAMMFGCKAQLNHLFEDGGKRMQFEKQIVVFYKEFTNSLPWSLIMEPGLP